MPSEDQRLNSLGDTMTEMKVSWALMTPTVLSSLHPEQVPHLRRLLIAGESLGESEIQGWCSKVELSQAYGLTEWAGIFALSPRITTTGERRTIGTPVNGRAWLVDLTDASRLAPIGAPGELVIAGPALANGYFQDPKRTQASFTSRPPWISQYDFSNGVDRLYTTGDIMRYNPNGSLAYIRRKDSQVKIRGNRVELGEVEYHLMQLIPKAKRVIAVAIEPQRSHDQQILTAFIHLVPDDDGNPFTSSGGIPQLHFIPINGDVKVRLSEAHERLKDRLPDYMIPQFLIPLEALPTTATGKVDRQTLRSLANELGTDELRSRAGCRADYRAPCTDNERLIQEMICCILHLAPEFVGMRDNFFHLGGDSVAAMKLAGLASRRLIALTVRDIFARPVLEDLAAEICRAREKICTVATPFGLVDSSVQVRIIEEVAAQCQLDAAQVIDVYPCTPLQEGLCALSFRDPTRYKARVVCKVRAGVDSDALRDAWEKVFQRNDILRTRLVTSASSSSGTVQALVREGFQWDEAEDIETYVAWANRESMGPGKRLVRACLFTKPETTLILTIHHAVCDRWSIRLLLDQMQSLLSPAGEIRHQSFRPFIEYLAEIKPGLRDYWTGQFDGLTAAIFPELPAPDYAPKADQVTTYHLRLPQRVLRDWTITAHVRLAWALVIAHNTSVDDVVFGATVTGRGAAVRGIEALSGPTIATVPLRVTLDSGSSVADSLGKIQEKSVEMIPYEQAGLQQIQKYSPQAEAACMFQSHVTVQPAWKELPSIFTDCQEGAAVAGGFASYALCLECYPSRDEREMAIVVSFDSMVVSLPRVQRILKHLEFALCELFRRPYQSLSAISHISPFDLTELGRLNAEVPTKPQATVHDVIQARIREMPQQPAVCAWDGELTYTELDHYSSHLAAELVRHGCHPGMMIPIYMEKSRWAIVAMVAVIRAGAGVVPLDPSYPMARIRAICEQVKSPVVLCSHRLVEATAMMTRNRIVVGQSVDIWRSVVDTYALPRVEADALLYLIFTSGSTGEPKGLMVDHGAFCASAMAYIPEMQLDRRSRMLQFASFAFDICFTEIFATLMAGGCVCVPCDTERMNDIHAAVRKLSATHAIFTPSYARLISADHVPSLRLVALAGEAPLASDVEYWGPHVQLLNVYGPAECSPISATQSYDGRADTHPQDIGFPRGCVPWICDPRDHDSLVPIGATGELLIEGPTVGTGYLNDLAKTARAFVQAPQWLQTLRGGECARIYRTGDLVRYTADGRLRYIGRIGQQFKLRGQRLDPSHVEHNLLQSFDGAAVEVAALVATPNGAGGRPALVAFVLLRQEQDKTSGAELMAATARLRLQQKLPDYMVPSLMIPLSTMPRTASGKLDRRRLENEITTRTWDELMQYEASAGVIEPASSGVERELQVIWSRALQLPCESIGVNQSFFHLGGDSITAMLVVAQARTSELGLTFTVEDIFRLRTIAQLAIRAKANTTRAQMITADDVLEKPFRLSPVQQLFFDNNQRQPPHRYSHNLLLHMAQSTTLDELQVAIHGLARNHAMLRARFAQGPDGNWQQRISREVTGSFRCRRIPLECDSELPAALANAQQALNISTGPVFSADLIEVKGKQLLFLVAHHLVVDLVSWTVLLADLRDLLLHRTVRSSSSISFQAWCDLLEDYGHTTLPAPTVTMEMDRMAGESFWGVVDGQNTIGNATECVVTIDETTTNALLGASNQAFGTKPVELLHAALLFAFSAAFPSRATPVIFSEAHGREPWDPSVDLTRTVGWFTTFAPVEVAIDAGDDLQTVVRLVKDARRRIQHNGFEAFTAQYFNRSKQRATTPRMMEILFNYGGRYEQQLQQGDSVFQVDSFQRLSIFDAASEAERFAFVEINAFVQDGQLTCAFAFPKGCSRVMVLDPWIDHLHRAVEEIANTFGSSPRRYTLGDFPSLALDYPQLDMLMAALSRAGILPDLVDDVYPCSPIQRGILLSQAKNPTHYHVVIVWEVINCDEKPISIQDAQSAIEQVITRHPSLRTVFLETTSGSAVYDQVVVRDRRPDIPVICTDEEGSSPIHQVHKHFPLSPSCPLRFTISVDRNQKIYIRLDISHALTDAKSLTILQQDLRLALTANLTKQPGVPYANYISYLQQTDAVADGRFWKQYLTGCEATLFPGLTDSADLHPNVTKDFTFTVDRACDVPTYCRSRGVTPANVYCLAWALVLRSFVGSDDVCFGNLSSGRELAFDGAGEVVGPLINMLTTRVKFGTRTLGELVNRLHADYVACLAHQTCSIADILHQNGFSETQLFNTGLSIERILPSAAAETATDLRLVAREDPTEYAIVFNVEIEEARTVVHLRYWTATLSDTYARLIATCFNQAVSEILLHDQRLASEVDLVAPQHRDLIHAWNATLPSASQSLVHQFIQQRVKQAPGDLAVCSSEGSFTYAELDTLSDAVSLRLMQAGVGPEVFVPLCFEKSRWTIVAMLGVIKAGAAFSLLDASHPNKRLETICQDLGTSVLVCSPTQAARCAVLATVVVIIGDKEVIMHAPQKVMAASTHMEGTHQGSKSALYVVYTSGTTGKPKGIVIEHGSFCAMVAAQSPILNMTSSSRMLQFSSYAFDVSIFEILVTLMTGGCVCILSEDERRDRFIKTVASLQPSHALLTPSFIRLISLKALPSLKVLVCGGESMSQLDINQWSGQVRLINHYGPAECSVCSVVQPSVTAGSRPGDIGTAAGCVTWIVDPENHERLAPVGAIGELVIEGPIVGRGYLKKLTSNQGGFIEPPGWLRTMREGAKSEDRLYKTGDLVRYGTDGRLYIQGRKDTQIKLRGQRIEIAELEYQARYSFPTAYDVVVDLVRTGLDRTPHLFAFVGLTKDLVQRGHHFLVADDSFRSQSSLASVKLLERLPSYMVPSYFIPLPTLPSTPTGKVDRKKLRSMASVLTLEQLQGYRPLAGNRRMPSSARERLLQGIWARVLAVTPDMIGVDDNFFQAGGDSVNAMKVAAAARQEGLNISVADIFTHPKLSALAVAGEAKAAMEFYPTPFSLCPVMDRGLFCMFLHAQGVLPPSSHIIDILPASSAQHFFLVRRTLHHFTFDLEGVLDVARLRQACETVYRRFSVLRTLFTQYDGQTLQVVLDDVPVPFRHVVTSEDLSELQEQLRTADRVKGMVMDMLPFAFILLSHSAGVHHSLIFRVTHAQWDGVSLPELFTSLADAYHGKQLLPMTPLSTVFYYRALRDKTSSLQFWKAYLQGSTMTELPKTAGLKPPDLSLGNTIWENINLQPSPEPPQGFTMATVVKAAWSLVLARETNSHDLVFGQTVNGRSSPLPDIDKMLGCCLNFIPVRARLQSAWTVRDLLHHTQEQYRLAVSHDDVDLDTIVKHCTDWPAETKLNSIVQHQNITLQHVLPIENMKSVFATHGYFRPLTETFIFTEPYDNILSVQLCVNPNVMALGRAQHLLRKLTLFIADLCRSPDAPIRTFMEE
jgi:amino acid adenylation domain-containing protein/non-ribosomal peptide synthase protein (TIGR01720 family)